VGIGYDAHAFAADRDLVLGGIAVEHERGLAGHSDADVLTHAVVDALLGAAGWGDLGDWYPPDDPKLDGASSVAFLAEVAERLWREGWRLVNLDTIVVAQEPRLAAQRARMRDCLADHLGLERNRVSVKATTPDHLGAIGRAEGIAAQAIVLLEAPIGGEGASKP